jgi:hypothetical protein
MLCSHIISGMTLAIDFSERNCDQPPLSGPGGMLGHAITGIVGGQYLASDEIPKFQQPPPTVPQSQYAVKILLDDSDQSIDLAIEVCPRLRRTPWLGWEDSNSQMSF